VAVIGKRVQEILFDKGEDPIGGSIKINGVYFKVIGVFASRQSGNQAERDLQTIYTPFTTAQQAFNQNNKVHWYAITSKDGVPASKAEDHALAILRERHTVAPDDNRAIGHFNLEEEFGKIQALFGGIRALMWIVGIGTLAAGAIGVSNILLIIVRERTKEIGIRRAVGATPWAIMGQILLEALVLTSVAGLLGLCAGVGVLEGISLVMAKAAGAGGQPSMFQNPGVSLANAAQALAILVGVGALAGSFPAQRAVAVTPVVALRSE
jgi:putative ABC transport system permease protein